MKIGVIGGGQLGRMLALAGTPLGMGFAFLDPAPDACAQALGEHIRADYGDQEHLRQLADEVDLVTFEFESVPAETVGTSTQTSAMPSSGSNCSIWWLSTVLSSPATKRSMASRRMALILVW